MVLSQLCSNYLFFYAKKVFLKNSLKIIPLSPSKNILIKIAIAVTGIQDKEKLFVLAKTYDIIR
jgi:hypothetical protein